jgi:2-amino-4-hydroxy-6-hydroxymethyldihydropteridine diphosphokinase
VTAVVWSIGSNLGERLDQLRVPARQAPFYGVDVRSVSPVYETEPVGGPAQPTYLNAVVLADTELSPYALLAVAHAIEQAAGRERAERWGPRTLDVDIVSYGDGQYDGAGAAEALGLPQLWLPHPRAHERAFVLVPWLDVDPQARLTGHGRVAELVARLDTGGVHRRDDLGVAWTPP